MVSRIKVIPDFDDVVNGMVFAKGVEGTYPYNVIETLSKGVDSLGKQVYPMKIIKESEVKNNGNKKSGNVPV